MLGPEIATLFKKPADREDGGLMCQRTIWLLGFLFFVFFNRTKWGGMWGGKAKKKKRISYCKYFLFWLDSGRDVLMSSFLQPCTGRPSQDVSCELNKAILA